MTRQNVTWQIVTRQNLTRQIVTRQNVTRQIVTKQNVAEPLCAVAILLYGLTVAIAAFISRVSLDWSRLKNRKKKPRIVAIRIRGFCCRVRKMMKKFDD